ncbi:MAG: molybdenum cofactor synthesis domain-containing protein [Burkholderiaceae bacterium]|jgi:molybdenum cofactor biosynthesis protein B
MARHNDNRPKASLRAAVLTISDRRQPDDNESGDYLARSLGEAGHVCAEQVICPENIYAIRKTLSDWIANPALQVILTNGGTGFSHEQTTVTAIRPLLDATFTGFGELFRHLSYLDIGSSSLQSDAFAGMANNTLVFCLPGSPGACRLAWERIICEQLDSTHRPCNFASHYHA